jgi:hypothetical protein
LDFTFKERNTVIDRCPNVMTQLLGCRNVSVNGERLRSLFPFWTLQLSRYSIYSTYLLNLIYNGSGELLGKEGTEEEKIEGGWVFWLDAF